MVDTGVRKLSEEYTIDPKNGLIESMDLLLEKNKPTSPDKWQDCISQAKAKFDIFPSAYSNGWAAQCYKRKGGKWKSVNEDKMVFSEFLNKDSILRQIKEGKTKKVNKQKSRDWKDEQFLKGLESGKRISELLGDRKMTTADGKPARMGREVMEAQNPARQKQVDSHISRMRERLSSQIKPHHKARIYRDIANAEKVRAGEKKSGWTYDMDGEKIRTPKIKKSEHPAKTEWKYIKSTLDRPDTYRPGTWARENAVKRLEKMRGGVKEAVDKESMPCNKPRASTSPGKKKMVKACEGGQEKIIHYGAKGYGHNYSPAARKSFRARHSCEEKKTKLGAQHWACKDLWAGKGGSTKSCPEGRKCKY